MQTPLNAAASTAGELFSSSTFEVPQFQREYSWQEHEVEEFWSDLSGGIDSTSYFLGLVILTAEGDRKLVVDGQQRIVTLTLLANALYHEATKRKRHALAERIQSDFLRSINYATDETDPRVILSDNTDNSTIQHILETGQAPILCDDVDTISARLAASYRQIQSKLTESLRPDPFKLLGTWTDFITNRLYFAVFVHPDASSAYQVFEVINTRGRELTTADLLKNYVLSQTGPEYREDAYRRWQNISGNFPPEGSGNTFVQYIRHVVTVHSGHILPKDLFGFLAMRNEHPGREPPNPSLLLSLLEDNLSAYLQMIDPSLSGPATREHLPFYSAFNSLGVITVRPILLALGGIARANDGLDFLLRLVVRRMVVGNLGTGNVERRLSEAAHTIKYNGDWTSLEDDLKDLNPDRTEYVEQLRKRSFNKRLLTFIRRSIVQSSITPEQEGTLHFVWPKNSPNGWLIEEEAGSYWAATIGNTFLSSLSRRPSEASTGWSMFKETMFASACTGEQVDRLSGFDDWNVSTIETVGKKLANEAGDIWYR
ncbi:MAG: DUF262 domain-containing protein [Rhodospirillales bacterium]|nr:DUF262 domain-containing protein [Rhodospirillales bacterium]